MDKNEPEIVGTTGELGSRVRGAAFYAVKNLRPEQSVVLLTAEEQNLCPRWRARLARRGAAEGAALLERARALLAE
ncbi:MAG: hypothetical protein OEP48_12960 [Betaproteobacteria bacterium]|nr:hypothetical protein [Betaproteobacteria bacterium]MDH3437135.1 hypothetical protein [Betaproteobacteria bacterium]